MKRKQNIADSSPAVTMTVEVSKNGDLYPHYSLPPCFKNLHTFAAMLPSGLTVQLQNYHVDAPVSLPFNYEPNPFFFFSFVIQGTASHSFGTRTSAPEMQYKGPFSMFCAFQGAGTCVIDSATPVQALSISVSQECLCRLLGDSIGILPQVCSHDLSDKQGFICESSATLTPAMHMAVHQILQLQKESPLAPLVLESKTLELLVHFVKELNKTRKKTLVPHDAYITPIDREKLHAARDILCQEYTEPPTIAVLARRVGMNECKLKTLFKRLFGSTIYRYVQRERMSRAEILLREGMDVSQVASRMGYVNNSHFAAAYRRHHGKLPSASKKCHQS